MTDAVLKAIEDLKYYSNSHARRLDNYGSDITALKSDVAVLKSDVAVLKSDVSVLKADVHRLGLLFEAMDQKLNQVLEIVQWLAEEYRRLGPISETLQNHEHRISALEHVYKT